MKDIKGFLKFKREAAAYRPVCERVLDYREVSVLRKDEQSKTQGARCMDCGTPFCHWGCPVGNYIPEWNDLMSRGHWERAFQLLDATNNFPEITGRICPAPCEYSCVLGINDDPVTIREDELAIIEHAFKTGLIRPRKPALRTQKNAAVIGSGPAGLACAAQLNKAGHRVTVFERDERIGGILRYGIPDFKLEKWVIDRRVDLLKKEGIRFVVGVDVGGDIKAKQLLKDFDAVCLAGGSRVPRDLNIEGRGLKNIYFAMDYLRQAKSMDARGKRVVVIGGGDTGADCVGVAHRQAASCVIQIEILPKPSECRTEDYSWPKYPLILKTTTSHEEGGERKWSILTKKFIGQNGSVKGLACAQVEFSQNAAICPAMKELPGTGFEVEADMVILAMGFTQPEHKGLLDDLGLEFDPKGNVRTDQNFATSVRGIFAAGDMRRGQSLIVWAISEGRGAAASIDKYLMGSTSLPLT